MQLEFTAVYRKVPEGFIAFVEELPGANTQGATLDEARRNLREAVVLTLEANRALAEEELGGSEAAPGRRQSLRLRESTSPQDVDGAATPRDQRVPRPEDLP